MTDLKANALANKAKYELISKIYELEAELRVERQRNSAASQQIKYLKAVAEISKESSLNWFEKYLEEKDKSLEPKTVSFSGMKIQEPEYNAYLIAPKYFFADGSSVDISIGINPAPCSECGHQDGVKNVGS